MPMTPLPPRPLRPEGADRGALDEAAMRDADDGSFVGDQIFHVDLAFVGTSWVRRGPAYFCWISRSSFLMIWKTRISFARMSRRSLIVSISSLYSLTIFSRSSPVS
jgi:hypothetical protein